MHLVLLPFYKKACFLTQVKELKSKMMHIYNRKRKYLFKKEVQP
jgi:hypothetical protein